MRARWLLVVAVLLAIPQVAEACPVCYGDIDGPEARGVNNGVLTMLGVVFSLQIGFGVMFVNMMRRARNAADETPNSETSEVTDTGRE